MIKFVKPFQFGKGAHLNFKCLGKNYYLYALRKLKIAIFKNNKYIFTNGN